MGDFSFKCKDFTDGFYKLNQYLFFHDAYDYFRSGITAHTFDIVMKAEHFDCDLHLHDLNYTMNKWKMLNNLYIDPVELGVFLARIKYYKEDQSHKRYVPDIAMQFKTRRNMSGACLLNIAMGFHQDKWRCSITTRASELTCRWPMDLIFIHVLLKLICDYLNIPYGKVCVYWYMISTYQSMTSMPYFLAMAGQEQWIQDHLENTEGLTKWQAYTIKRFKKCYIEGAYTKYKVQKRPMDAYKMLKGEVKRTNFIWTSDLSIGFVPFKGVFEKDYDEVDLIPVMMEQLDELVSEAKDNDLVGKGGYR